MQKRVIVETITGPLAGIPRIIGCLKIGPGQPVQQRFLRVDLGGHVGDAELIRQNKTYVWYREVNLETQPAMVPAQPLLRVPNDGDGDEPGAPVA